MLSHNGGRVTEELKMQKSGIEMVGDVLQIMPQDIHRILCRLDNGILVCLDGKTGEEVYRKRLGAA